MLLDGEFVVLVLGGWLGWYCSHCRPSSGLVSSVSGSNLWKTVEFQPSHLFSLPLPVRET